MKTRIAAIARRIHLAVVLAFTCPSTLLRTPRLRGSLAKGPTFIEYAMMAAIVVVIGLALKFLLGGWFSRLENEISNYINNF